jgi:hypothetical protein
MKAMSPVVLDAAQVFREYGGLSLAAGTATLFTTP